jgi:hypothetical protein
MKKIILFLLAILWMGGIGVKGQDIILSEQFRNGELPDGWSEAEVTFTPDAGGYARFESSESYLVTPIIDLSDFINVYLKFDVAKFGAGDDGPITVDISDDGGVTWIAQSFNSPIPSDANYETSGPTPINATGTNIVIRFSRPDSPSQKRLRDIVLTGDLLPNTNYLIDFEGATKGSYASGVVNLSGLDWNFTEVMIGSTVPDWKNGSRSARLRGYGESSMTMLEDKPNGLGILSFSYRRYGTDQQVDWRVEYSLNQGLDWVRVGDDFTAWDTDEIQFFNEDVDVTGNVRVRIKRASEIGTVESRLNIDDILLTDYFVCTNLTGFYRSVSDGLWMDGSVWEVSENGVDDWLVAGCAPFLLESAAIKVQNNLIVDKNLNVKDLFIENNSKILLKSGQLKVNGSGTNLTIESGGVLEFDGGEIPFIENGANVLVKNGGIVRVKQRKADLTNYIFGNESLGRYIFEGGAIVDWNNSNAFQTGSQTLFPGVATESIPVLRISTGVILAETTTPTTINGLLEANANLEWRGSGPKTFRNGITGTGNITQAATSGPFVITGMNAQLTGPGILQLNANGLQINGNVSMGSNKTIAGGPVTINGSLHAGTFALTLGGSLSVGASGSLSMADATLILNGDATQSLLLTQPLTLNGLTVFNPAGVNANQNITIRNNLVMNGGSVEVGENILTLGISGVQTGSLTRTSGAVNGKFRRWIPSVVSADDVLFPVGKGTRYVPVRLRFLIAPAAGTLTGEFISIIGDNTQYYGNLPIQDGDLTIDNLSSAGYWIIDAGDGFGPAPYEIAVFPDDVMQFGLNSPERARIVKRVGEFEPWEIAGSFQTGEVTQIRHTNVTSGFSQFALGGNMSDNPLPVELLRFEARNLSDKVLLEWSTATETNNDHFIVERSTDMHEIVPLGQVAGAGNSNNILHYLFTDQDPLAGINYYRLKQTDFDGTFEYSDWIAVHLQEEPYDFFGILHVVQKNDKVKLAVRTRDGARINISVSDIHGRVVYRSEFTAISDVVRYEFDPVASGVLIVTVADGYSRMTEKLLIVPR